MNDVDKKFRVFALKIYYLHTNMNGYLTLDSYPSMRSNKCFDEKTMSTVDHIVKSIQNASNNISSISPYEGKGQQILGFEGYTGTKTRHFYNNICSSKLGVRYLEVGTWYGSSSISAVYQNQIDDALFVDNWSQFGGNSDVFKDNLEKYVTKTSKYDFIEGDCWKIDTESLKSKKFNVYLYDGEHFYSDQYKALSHFLPALDDQFIFMIDDWNWPQVRDGTMDAIRDLKLNVQFRHEIFLGPDDLEGMPNHKGKDSWWNGVGIFLLSK